jgi:hypothetical protein
VHVGYGLHGGGTTDLPGPVDPTGRRRSRPRLL